MGGPDIRRVVARCRIRFDSALEESEFELPVPLFERASGYCRRRWRWETFTSVSQIFSVVRISLVAPGSCEKTAAAD